MINIRNNKILLAFLLILSSTSVSEVWAMKGRGAQLFNADSSPAREKNPTFLPETRPPMPQYKHILHDDGVEQIATQQTQKVPAKEDEGQKQERDALVAQFNQLKGSHFAESRTEELAQRASSAHLNVAKNILQNATSMVKDNRNEFWTAIVRLIAVELSCHYNNKNVNSKKASFTSIIAYVCRILNDRAALQNQQNRGYIDELSFIDKSTILLMFVDAGHIVAKTTNLVLKQDSGSVPTLTDSKDDAKINKILKIVKAFGKIAPHIEGILALARSGTKFGHFQNPQLAQLCTQLLCVTRIAEYYVQTADSKSNILKAGPCLIAAIVCLAFIRDKLI